MARIKGVPNFDCSKAPCKSWPKQKTPESKNPNNFAPRGICPNDSGIFPNSKVALCYISCFTLAFIINLYMLMKYFFYFLAQTVNFKAYQVLLSKLFFSFLFFPKQTNVFAYKNVIIF